MTLNEMASTEMLAVKQLSQQLEKLDVSKKPEVMAGAINGITGIALASKDANTKISVINVLGNYGGIQPKQEETRSDVLKTQQAARANILGIALTADNIEVRSSAIETLGKSLEVTDLGEGENHRNVVLDVATIAVNSGDATKQKAVEILSQYANKKVEAKGYVGTTAFPDVQKLANELVGAIAS